MSDADRAAARELGREGLLALAARQYTKADDRLGRALALYPAPTLYLGRARARLALGKLVAAAEDLRAIVGSNASPGESEAFAQARVDARAELEALERQIPRLTVSSDAPLVRLFVNGAEWPVTSLGVARPVDPGPYVIEGISAADTRANRRVDLRTAQSQTVTLEPSAAPQPTAANTSASVAVAAGTQPAPELFARERAAPNRTAAYVSGAITLALVVGAVVSGVIALERRAEFSDRNRSDVPMDDKNRLRSTASAWAWVNTGLSAGALAGAGLTTYFFFSSDDSEPPAGNAHVVARERTGMRLGVRGRF